MASPLDGAELQIKLRQLIQEFAPEDDALQIVRSRIRATAVHDFSQYLFLAPVTGDYRIDLGTRIEREVTEAGAPGGRAADLGFGSGGSDLGGSLEGVLSPPSIEAIDTLDGFIDTVESALLGLNLPDYVCVAPPFPRIVLRPRRLSSERDYAQRIVNGGLYPGLVASADGLFRFWVDVSRPSWFWNEVDWLVTEFLAAEYPVLATDSSLIEEIESLWPDPSEVMHEDAIGQLSEPSRWTRQLPLFKERLSEERARRDLESQPTSGTPALPESFPFVPYAPGSVNLGVQLVYRQHWTPLGNQEGEILRTVPLGPKQSEKVSIKAIHRSKATRQTEVVTSIETTTESSTATKDSSEVVSEASNNFKWNVEASASASFGFGSASLSAGVGEESASSSKDVKSTLNEAMSKTASRMRQDTKIVVSLEVEDTTEMARESEISNPNDEVAVTYVYSRLQRQYEIYTELAEANACMLVAERVPIPREIDGPWIRKHDWILAGALLSESFRGDLEVVRSQEPEDLHAAPEGVDTEIGGLMSNIATGLPSHEAVEGAPPDIYSTPQHTYEREVERARERRAKRETYNRSVRRLQWHIYDHILHYMRAIWSSEDPQQRLLRYARISAPTRWAFVGSYSSEGVYVGTWRPELESTAKLSDLINPAGPIGFAGNYAVFYLKQDGRYPEIDDAVNYLRLPYTLHWATAEIVRVTGAVSIAVAVSPNRLGGGSYDLEIVGGSTPGEIECSIDMRDPHMVDVDESGRAVTATYDAVASMPIGASGGDLAFHGLRVTLAVASGSSLQVGDAFTVTVSTDALLEDPELRALRFAQRPRTAAQEADFFTPEVLAEIEEFFAPIRRAFARIDPPPADWSELDEAARELVREYSADYDLRKLHTRRFLLETNNVLLSRVVDSATSIEPFKSLHRYLDILSAAADLDKKSVENQRRQARIDAGQLGDPDVEKLTVVASTPGASHLAALDGLTDDPELPEGPVPEDPGSER